jgi:hypothetical protein
MTGTRMPAEHASVVEPHGAVNRLERRRPGVEISVVERGSHEARLVRIHHGLDSVAQAELGKDVRDVRLDGRLRHEQVRSDLAV